MIQSDPEPGEDLDTHIHIYEKCLDNPCRKNILEKYYSTRLKKAELAPEMPAQTDGQGSNMAMNMMAQQSNPNTTPMATM